jgi:hypothetical protein
MAARGDEGPVSVDDLARFAATCEELTSPDVMGRAWQ